MGMQAFSLLWSLLFAIHSILVPLELTLARMPNGHVLAASLHSVGSGVNAVRAHLEKSDGSWTEEEVDEGSIFSVSTPVMLAGFAYLAAVCNFAVCVYRRDLSNPSAVWEGKQLSGIGNVASVTLALTAAGLLALTLQTLTNEWWLFTGPHTATLAALTFTSVQGFSGIIDPFDGGDRAVQAQGPGGASCHLVRLAAVTALAALCYAGGVWQTVTLESMAAPTAGDLDIEASALYSAGFYYFMYVLASGVVRLARVAETTLAVTLLTLGSLSLLPGIVPGVAMQVVGDHLVAAWPGAAVAVSLVAFTLIALSGFPLTVSGPIALLSIGTAAVLACGSSSIECTIGAPPVPAARGGPLAALAAGLLVAGLLALARRPARGLVSEARRRSRRPSPAKR
jgi:hypothetical protein